VGQPRHGARVVKRGGKKIEPRVADALVKMLDSPTNLGWRGVKFDSRDPIIVAAVRAAKPPADVIDGFRADVASARYAITEAAVARVKIKEVGDAAEVYAAALRRVQRAWKPDLLPPDLELNPLTLAKLIGSADELAHRSPNGRPQHPVEFKRDAAMHAYALMEKHGLEIKGTKGSNYCRLAAALTGRRDDLVRQCQAHLRHKKRQRGKTS
jgi:hypothetical protein